MRLANLTLALLLVALPAHAGRDTTTLAVSCDVPARITTPDPAPPADGVTPTEPTPPIAEEARVEMTTREDGAVIYDVAF
jgi:hypothetical protein